MDDLIEQLAATPRTLALLVVEAGDAQLDAAAAGAWSARTILAHLRDDEYLCMRVALERMLAEEAPLVHFIDGAGWEPARNRSRDRKDLLLADFALQRQASLGILRALRPQDWQRPGVRQGGETLTIAGLAGGWARHDATHVAQLETALGETLAGVIERRARPAE